MVTGANQGIGYETAKDLAKRGATLHLVCRNKERGEKARDEIVAATNNSDVQLHVADLSSVSQTKALAQALLATGQPLHLLVNNAGCLVNPRCDARAALLRAARRGGAAGVGRAVASEVPFCRGCFFAPLTRAAAASRAAAQD